MTVARRTHDHTHVAALLLGARDVAVEEGADLEISLVLVEGLRRLLAALERHGEIGPGYARRVGRSVAIDLLRRRRAAEDRRRRAEEKWAAADARAREQARLLAAVRRRAERMRPLLTPTQARDLDAALERLATLSDPEGRLREGPVEEDHRARQLLHQARRRGMVLLSEGTTATRRRVCPPASEAVRAWIAGRRGGHATPP